MKEREKKLLYDRNNSKEKSFQLFIYEFCFGLQQLNILRLLFYFLFVKKVPTFGLRLDQI